MTTVVLSTALTTPKDDRLPMQILEDIKKSKGLEVHPFAVNAIHKYNNPDFKASGAGVFSLIEYRDLKSEERTLNGIWAVSKSRNLVRPSIVSSLLFVEIHGLLDYREIVFLHQNMNIPRVNNPSKSNSFALVMRRQGPRGCLDTVRLRKSKFFVEDGMAFAFWTGTSETE